jgi:hypothetical protein
LAASKTRSPTATAACWSMTPRTFGPSAGPIQTLLADRERALQMGAQAHRRVCEEYLAPRRLTREMELINVCALSRCRHDH